MRQLGYGRGEEISGVRDVAVVVGSGRVTVNTDQPVDATSVRAAVEGGRLQGCQRLRLRDVVRRSVSPALPSQQAVMGQVIFGRAARSRYGL
ncbi:MAG: hypothetical protein JWN06_2384 [Propionibacteriaceae bacterium]|jgi:hypothetical protein|nr:hypothetical protein [Propionibacteriaceae bacterium]